MYDKIYPLDTIYCQSPQTAQNRLLLQLCTSKTRSDPTSSPSPRRLTSQASTHQTPAQDTQSYDSGSYVQNHHLENENNHNTHPLPSQPPSPQPKTKKRPHPIPIPIRHCPPDHLSPPLSHQIQTSNPQPTKPKPKPPQSPTSLHSTDLPSCTHNQLHHHHHQHRGSPPRRPPRLDSINQSPQAAPLHSTPLHKGGPPLLHTVA